MTGGAVMAAEYIAAPAVIRCRQGEDARYAIAEYAAP
jgi:hypothetical protein